MNIYLVTQDVNSGYDTYDSMIVVAPDEDTARRTYPSDHVGHYWNEARGCWGFDCVDGSWAPDDRYSAWAPIHELEVTLIGVASPDMKPGVVSASFNAG